VLAWTAAALAAEVVLVARSLPVVAPLAAALVAAAALATWRDRRAIAPVLAAAYVFPVAFRLAYGRYHVDYTVLWMAALFGAMAPALAAFSWRMPVKWRAPLVLFALTIVVGGSLVVWREIDFTGAPRRAGIVPVPARSAADRRLLTIWVLRVALVLLLGMLWFDWLYTVSPPLGFRRYVVLPLALSALAMAGVAIYQLFVDVTFLNETVYGNIGRASGTVFDANVCGVIAALWIGGRARRDRLAARTAGDGCRDGGRMAGGLRDGSRTAFGAAVIVTLSSLVALYAPRACPYAGRRDEAARPRAPGGGRVLAALALIVVLANARVDVVGPLGRVWRRCRRPRSSPSRRSRRRCGTGTATARWPRMIAGRPGSAWGSGRITSSCRTSRSSCGRGSSCRRTTRRTGAGTSSSELGLVGSVGWILWVAAFGWFVTRRRPRPAFAVGGAGDAPRLRGGVAPRHAGAGACRGPHVLDDGLLVRADRRARGRRSAPRRCRRGAGRLPGQAVAARNRGHAGRGDRLRRGHHVPVRHVAARAVPGAAAGLAVFVRLLLSRTRRRGGEVRWPGGRPWLSWTHRSVGWCSVWR
jgi:hypothetical protein